MRRAMFCLIAVCSLVGMGGCVTTQCGSSCHGTGCKSTDCTSTGCKASGCDSKCDAGCGAFGARHKSTAGLFSPRCDGGLGGCSSNGCGKFGGGKNGCGANGGGRSHSHGICDCEYDDYCTSRSPWVRLGFQAPAGELVPPPQAEPKIRKLEHRDF